MPWTLHLTRPVGWAARPVSLPAVPTHAARTTAPARHWAAGLVLWCGAVFVLLLWMVCAVLIAVEMVRWWAEFVVRTPVMFDPMLPGW